MLRFNLVLREYFAPYLAKSMDVADLVLFVEGEPGALLQVHSLHPMGRDAARSAGQLSITFVQETDRPIWYARRMDSISQEQATDRIPLTQSEVTRFWRDRRFGGMECMSATFLTHEFAPHSHDTFSIGAIERGCQVCTIKGSSQNTGPGGLYLINPGETHDGAPKDGGYRYRMIYPEIGLLREVIEDVTGKPVKGTPAFGTQLLQDEALAGAFHEAHRTLEESNGALESSQGMFEVLDAMFRRHGSTIIAPVDTSERTAVRRARDYLIAHYASDVGLEELANVAGLSRAHLIRAFRKEYHITPHSFLTDIRIRQARELLRAGGQPAEIALECGFADQAHFTRHFKARTGLTPGQYRAR